MKKSNFLIFIFITVSVVLFAQNSGKHPKILIAYFTLARNIDLSGEVDTSTHASVKLIDGIYKGDTEIVAGWIRSEVGGDLSAIKTSSLYPGDYDEAVDQGGKELKRNARPELSSRISNIEDYDIIFLGYPVWWRDVPMAVYTFLETYNLKGKTIIPYSTHMGGGIGSSVKTIRKLEPDATVLDTITILDACLFDFRGKVKEWLDEIGIKQG